MNCGHEHLAIQQTLPRFIAEEIRPHVDGCEDDMATRPDARSR